MPILADEINRLVASNKQLAAQGKPIQNVFKRIGGAIFSFNSLMSIAITLVVVYGKQIGEWVTQLFNAEKAVSTLALSQENLNKAQEEGAKSSLNRNNNSSGFI